MIVTKNKPNRTKQLFKIIHRTDTKNHETLEIEWVDKCLLEMIPNYEESDDKIMVPIPRQNFLRHFVSLSMPYLKVRENLKLNFLPLLITNFGEK